MVALQFERLSAVRPLLKSNSSLCVWPSQSGHLVCDAYAALLLRDPQYGIVQLKSGSGRRERNTLAASIDVELVLWGYSILLPYVHRGLRSFIVNISFKLSLVHSAQQTSCVLLSFAHTNCSNPNSLLHLRTMSVEHFLRIFVCTGRSVSNRETPVLPCRDF